MAPRFAISDSADRNWVRSKPKPEGPRPAPADAAPPWFLLSSRPQDEDTIHARSRHRCAPCDRPRCPRERRRRQGTRPLRPAKRPGACRFAHRPSTSRPSSIGAPPGDSGRLRPDAPACVAAGGRGRCVRGLLRQQVRLQLRAPDHGDPGRCQQRQSGARRGHRRALARTCDAEGPTWPSAQVPQAGYAGVLRQVEGGSPNSRLKARLKAASVS